jgi:predicted ATP-binding protein involved in virulence
MHLQRIQIPEFRVLKDVDITFEQEFTPSIFPLGSQNGGGKSTLLQLIFVLLHCSTHSDRIPFLKSMLQGFKVAENSHKRVLANIEIWDGNKNVQLEFFCCKDSSLQEILNDNGQSGNDSSVRFSDLIKLEALKDKIPQLENQIQTLENVLERLENYKTLEESEEKRMIVREQLSRLREYGFTIPNILKRKPMNLISIEEVEEQVKLILDAYKSRLGKSYKEHEELKLISQEILKFLEKQRLTYICNYSSNLKIEQEEVLLCHSENVEITNVKCYLKDVSQKVFLAAPATQVFLFLSQQNRKLLFRAQNSAHDYYSHLKDAKARLPGFFTYDFLAVDLLIESFKAARDKDFREAIATGGEYGKSYKALVDDLNLMLVNKKIILNEDFSGVTFKLNGDGENIELYPEDLSHGEMKRLSIYMWMKYHNIENAIVLMDEIEIAFHPDWQYQIISDLEQWSPTNQYILATHSYELCQALTPSHVKELEPKLLKQKAKN